MQIRNVETMILDTGRNYQNPAAASEAHGVRFVSLIEITTGEGITGWSDIETQPHVARTVADFLSSGEMGFEPLKNALVGEDPMLREQLWQKKHRYLGYFGRQGGDARAERRRHRPVGYRWQGAQHAGVPTARREIP